MFEDFPKNEIEFDRRFRQEQDCLDYLFSQRWPDGFVCPECGHPHYWKSARDLYRCRHCQKQVSVTTGTIFHGAKKSLILWFKALWWFSARTSGVNAIALQQLLGLGSYRTAWHWLQRLRTCTVFPDRQPLTGKVESDEFYLGGERSGKRGRGADHKCKVAVAVERQGKRLGRLRLSVIDDCSSAQLLPFVKAHVLSGSLVVTDGWKGYNGLERDFIHHRVLSSQAEEKESVLPGVHLVVSLVKRVILGTYQGRFNPEYLQRYLDEYVFRFNRRTCAAPGKRFWRIMQQAVSLPPLTNRQLRFRTT